MDEEFRKLYPNYSEEEIKKGREKYVEIYGNGLKRRLPPPERKENIEKRSVSIEQVAETIAERYKTYKSERDSKISLSKVCFQSLCYMVTFILIFAILLNPSSWSVLSFCVIVVLVALAIISKIISDIPKKERRDLIYQKILNGECILCANLITDTYRIYDDSSDSTRIDYYLKLKRFDTLASWRDWDYYVVDKEQYLLQKPGDMVYLMYFNDKHFSDLWEREVMPAEPIYFLNPNICELDETLLQFIQKCNSSLNDLQSISKD